MIDWQRVHAAVLALEEELGGDGADNDVVMTRLLGVEFDDAFEAFLKHEHDRVADILRWHLTTHGIRPTLGSAATIGLLQGITIARAVDRVREGDPRG